MVSIFSPAKINLMLSVHGQRVDGFHDLSSIIVTLDFGDTIEVSYTEGPRDVLVCDDLFLPTNGENLILRASELLRQSMGLKRFFLFKLQKKVPIGAGLGGGSSNAVAAIKGILKLINMNVPDVELQKLVAEIGSDCSFFVNPVPSLMEGRGENIRALDINLREKIHGRNVIVFKPEYSISTQEAYGALNNSAFESKSIALERIKNAEEGGRDFLDSVLYNSFSGTTQSKYLSLATLLDSLNSQGFPSLMSGSGSACFSLLSPKNDAREVDCIKKTVINALGKNVFLERSSII